MADTEFIGITSNDCFIEGKVVGDPTIVKNEYGLMKVRTKVSELGVNGAWTDTLIDVPVITTDQAKIKVLENFVKDGREIKVYCYYKNWDTEDGPQHAFFIMRLQLGRKKFVPREPGQ